jgi:hypothetical protein
MPNMLTPENSTAIPSLSWLDSSLLPHRPRFNPRTFHMGFAAHEVAFVQVVLLVFQVFPVSIIPHYFIVNTISLLVYHTN